MASGGDSVELNAAPRTSSKAIRLLIATCVVGVVVGAVGFVLPQLMGSRDEFGADRQAVITRVSDFVVTFNTYESGKKADYQRRVKPLMTPAYYKTFVKITNVAFQVVKDRKQSSGDVKVLSVAVDTIDEDSATAIVAHDRTVVNDGDTEGAIPQQFRWQVSLRKMHGKWLVNQADEVRPVEATLGDLTADNKSGAQK